LVEDERASNWTSPSACRSRWSRRSDTIMIVPGRRVALITAVRGLRSTYGTPQVRGRAGQFAGSFDAVLADAGIEVVEIPPLCPRANCFAERFVLTIHTERTDRMLIFGERHLRQILTGYAAHYNTARPHRALRVAAAAPNIAGSRARP
jgi:transposase InsO family protein